MADPASNDTPQKKTRWRLPALLLLLSALAAGGYWAWPLLQPHPASEQAAAPPIFMALEPFTVNLQPGGLQRHLHVAISVRVQDEDSQAQLTQYLPEVRSRVLAVLSNRQGQALMEPSARDALARELETALQRAFVPQQRGARIAGVMFTTFLLQ